MSFKESHLKIRLKHGYVLDWPTDINTIDRTLLPNILYFANCVLNRVDVLTI